jgi:site-specific DNA recombinase
MAGASFRWRPRISSIEMTSYMFIGGRLRCGRCGRAMVGFASKNVRRYRCSTIINVADRAQHCRGSVPATEAEQKVWGAIECILKQPELIVTEVQRQHDDAATRGAEYTREIALLNEPLAKCDREAQRWAEAYADEVISLDELKGFRAEIEARRQSLLGERQRLESAIAGIDQAVNHVDTLLGYCERVKQALQTFDEAEKRLALAALDIRATWIPGQPLAIQGSIPLEESSFAASTARYDRNGGAPVRRIQRTVPHRVAIPPA